MKFKEALELFDNNKCKMARELQVSRMTIHNWGVDPEKELPLTRQLQVKHVISNKNI